MGKCAFAKKIKILIIILLLACFSDISFAGSYSQYESLINSVSEHHDLDPLFVRAVIKTESDFDPMAKSRAGAMGLMQLMPDTARRFGVSSPYDPSQNIDGGVRYLKYLENLFNGNLSLMLAAYNAGESRVIKAGYNVPHIYETRNYVVKALRSYKNYLGSSSVSYPEMKRAGSVDYELPIPRIVVVEANEPTGSIGTPFTIRIVGANLGAYSPEGSITISFPDDPVMLVECKTDESKPERCQVYANGSTLATANGRRIASSYSMAELTVDNWSKGGRHWMELIITPFQRGKFRLNVRATVRDRYSMGYVNYPNNSWARDQQSWPVREFTFDVR